MGNAGRVSSPGGGKGHSREMSCRSGSRARATANPRFRALRLAGPFGAALLARSEDPQLTLSLPDSCRIGGLDGFAVERGSEEGPDAVAGDRARVGVGVAAGLFHDHFDVVVG